MAEDYRQAAPESAASATEKMTTVNQNTRASVVAPELNTTLAPVHPEVDTRSNSTVRADVSTTAAETDSSTVIAPANNLAATSADNHKSTQPSQMTQHNTAGPGDEKNLATTSKPEE